MAQNNKLLIKHFWNDVWNQGKIELIDKFIAPDFIAHDLPREMAHGPKGYKKYVKSCRIAFPDGQDIIQDLIAEDEKVILRYVGRGTHKGNFMGFKATGKKVKVPGVEIFRVVNGKIKENWSFWDAYSFLEQIGAIPLPPD